MLRDFSSLTDEEVLALDGRDLDRYVALACANRGVALPFNMPPKPTKPDASPDVTVFSVNAVHFTCGDAAACVATFINDATSRVETRYVPGPGYRQGVKSPDADVQISMEDMWSGEAWTEHGDAVGEFDQRLKEWTAVVNERNAGTRARAGIVEDIHGRKRALVEDMETRERWARELDRYLDLGLAEADARKALIHANPKAEEFLPAEPRQLPLLDTDA